jgi:hypothetical protein
VNPQELEGDTGHSLTEKLPASATFQLDSVAFEGITRAGLREKNRWEAAKP